MILLVVILDFIEQWNFSFPGFVMVSIGSVKGSCIIERRLMFHAEYDGHREVQCSVIIPNM